MSDDFPAKLEQLAKDVSELKNKRKDHWDKFQILAALLIPASIGLVGFAVSKSLKDAEIASADRMADANATLARVNSRVGQAALVKSFRDALVSDDPRARKLAIEAVLIALPEDGPRLVKVVEETDPDAEVRRIAGLQGRRERAAAFVKSLPQPPDGHLKLPHLWPGKLLQQDDGIVGLFVFS